MAEVDRLPAMDFDRKAPVNAPQAQRARAFGRVMDLLGYILLLINLYDDAFSGLLRYMLSHVGAAWIIYIPSVAIIPFCAAYLFISSISTRGMFYALAVFFGLSGLFVIALAFGRSAAEAAFAAYTLYPLFIAFPYIAGGRRRSIMPHLAIIWLIAVVGVFVNRFYVFPWIGDSYQILGQTVDASRQWSDFSVSRLAGFTRGSFSAGSQILITSCFLLSATATSRERLLRTAILVMRAAIWLISLYAIFLTTYKTALLAEFVVPAVPLGYLVLSRGFQQNPAGLAKVLKGYCEAVIGVLLFLVAALPLAVGAYYFRPTETVQGGFITSASLFDRSMNTWPAAWRLIGSDDNPVEWALGRGLGGIGASAYLLDPAHANPADNMFMYIYCSIGIGFLGLWWLLAKETAGRVVRRNMDDARVLVTALSGALIIGLTGTVFESVFPCFAVGLALAMGFFSTRTDR